MYKDFKGKTEEEAIEKAIKELGLEKDNFDVEILESKKGLFKAFTRIRVYYGSDDGKEETAEEEAKDDEKEELESEEEEDSSPIEVDDETKELVLAFVRNLLKKMGFSAKVQISSVRGSKIMIDIFSKSSPIIIGRQGKTLDAIQLLTNVYIAKHADGVKALLDVENYRIRHEESIVRNAYKVAEHVRESGKSKLLDPMNPYERRLVHTALNDFDGVDTKSEGEGLYKQVRIIPIKK